MVEIDILSQTETAEKKNIPFDAAHTYIAYIRDFSQGLAVYASETNKCHQLRRLTFKDRQIWPVTC